jgi:hypothetical protein
MIENNSMRRTQAEAGLQFPPIFFTEITLDGDTTPIRELLSQYPGLEPAIVDAVRVGGLSFLDAQHIATLRRLVAEAKAVPYAELLAQELRDTDQKYVVMGISKKALLTIQEYLIGQGHYSRRDQRRHAREAARRADGRLSVRSDRARDDRQHQGGRHRHQPNRRLQRRYV